MSSTDAASEKKIILISSDEETFVVERAVAVKMQTIEKMVDDGCGVAGIPLANVTSAILAKVLGYCKRHVAGGGDEDLKAFDADFVNVDHATLADLVLAAHYLNIESLLDLTCQTVADMIKDMNPEKVRTLFNIENNFTPDEEAKYRRENAWAFGSLDR